MVSLPSRMCSLGFEVCSRHALHVAPPINRMCSLTIECVLLVSRSAAVTLYTLRLLSIECVLLLKNVFSTSHALHVAPPIMLLLL